VPATLLAHWARPQRVVQISENKEEELGLQNAKYRAQVDILALVPHEI
jgi:hypothetical protein